jgi:AraC-like DNA-binding protein
VHLTRDAIADADALVPATACYTFLELAAAESGIEDLGFRIGEAGPVVPRVGWFGRRIASAPTLRQAAAIAYRLHPAHNSAERIWMHEADGRVALCHRFIAGGASRWPQTVATVVTAQLDLLRAAAGRAWRPDEILLSAPERATFRETASLDGVRVRFDEPVTAIICKAEVLDARLPSTAPVSDHGEAAWRTRAPAAAFSDSIEQLVTTLLASGHPAIHQTAEVLGVSARTLQRQLAHEGRSYGNLVARARLRAARAKLSDPSRKVIDVALDLGYSDPAHFSRAFRRWTGLAPGEYRRMQALER